MVQQDPVRGAELTVTKPVQNPVKVDPLRLLLTINTVVKDPVKV